MVRTWKEHEWNIGEKDIWQRSIWKDLYKWVMDVKIHVNNVNVYQKVRSTQEEFSHQEGRITKGRPFQE